MNINELPDDCLIQIFHRLQLKLLFVVAQVCHRWNAVEAIVSRLKQHSLTIYTECSNERDADVVSDRVTFFGIPMQNIEQEDCIKVTFEENKRAMNRYVLRYDPDTFMTKLERAQPTNNPENICDKLIERFPKVTMLSIFNCDISANQLVHLLSKWPDITDLKLITSTRGIFTKDQFKTKICPAIDSLASLMSLSLSCPIDEIPQLKIMSQLSQFNYGCSYQNSLFHNKPVSGLFNVLSQLSDEQINSISLYKPDNGTRDLKSDLTRLGIERPELARRIARISNCPINNLGFVSTNFFQSITYLSIDLEKEIDFIEICPALSELKSLSELRLTILSYMTGRMFKGKQTTANFYSLLRCESMKSVKMYYTESFVHRALSKFASVNEWATKYIVPAHQYDFRQLKIVFPNLAHFQCATWFTRRTDFRTMTRTRSSSPAEVMVTVCEEHNSSWWFGELGSDYTIYNKPDNCHDLIMMLVKSFDYLDI